MGIDILHIEKGYSTETRRDETLSFLVDTPSRGLENTRMGKLLVEFFLFSFFIFWGTTTTGSLSGVGVAKRCSCAYLSSLSVSEA